MQLLLLFLVYSTCNGRRCEVFFFFVTNVKHEFDQIELEQLQLRHLPVDCYMIEQVLVEGCGGGVPDLSASTCVTTWVR